METIENEIQDALIKRESMERKKFMLDVEPHFKISYADKDLQMIKFVADRCFTLGFQRGMSATLDVMQSFREKQMESHKKVEGNGHLD